MKISNLAAALVAVLAPVVSSAQSTTVMDSLSIPNSGFITFDSNGNSGVAQRFTTDGVASYVTSVSAKLQNFGTTTVWSPNIRIVSDSSGAPNLASVQATFNYMGGSTLTMEAPNEGEVFSFIAGTSAVLNTNTSYWLVFSGVATGGSLGVMAISAPFTPPNLSSSWFNNATDKVVYVGENVSSVVPDALTLVSINATAIPEPSSFAAFAGLASLGAIATRRRRR